MYSGESKLYSGDKKLEIMESQKLGNLESKRRGKSPGALNKRNKQIKMLSGHSYGPNKPVEKF